MTDSKKLNLILEKVTALDGRMDSFDNQMHSLNERMESFETDLHELRQHVNSIDLTIENEIRVNIQRVAEGHLDLSRLLHDAARPNNEVEMLSLRVSMLESDVKKLKEKAS